MIERNTPLSINEQATRWVARIDAAPLDSASERELEQWLAIDERHRGALFRAEVVWRMLDRANALGAQRSASLPSQAQIGGVSVSVDDMPAEAADTAICRRGMLWSGGAVAASLIVGGLGLRAIMTRTTPRQTEAASQRIRTTHGEIRHVPLNDGSKVVMNTASVLEVAFTPARRDVRLDAGEAWFEVAKNAARPFVVTAGDANIRAVGTAFSVRKVPGGAEISVTEGVVDVWVRGLERDRRAVGAGASTFVAGAGGVQAPLYDAAEISRRLAWREGVFRFEGETLATAVAEFNRYNRLRMEVDPGLAAEKVIGRFNIDQPDLFARAVSTMFGARVERSEGSIRIARH
jgi:transmembrane sensor